MLKARQFSMPAFREDSTDIVQQTRLIAFDHQQIVAPLATIFRAISFWQPMASMLTRKPLM